MANYNGGAGLNQQALNKLSKDIYDSVYPTFFKGEIEIGKFGIKKITWDITQTPVFDLNPSEKAISILKEMASNKLDDTGLINQLHSYIEESVITFELSVPVFEVTVETTEGDTSLPIKGSITVYNQAEITVDNKLVGKIIDAEIGIEGEPTLVWILNHIVLPVVEDQLNKILLKGIQLPTLSFGDVKISTPVAALESETLLAFAALSSHGPTEPPEPGSPWPQDKFFALSDHILIETVAVEVLKNTQQSGRAHTTIGTLSLEASYTAGVKNPSVQLTGGNQLTMGVVAYGSGTLKAQLWPFPAASLGIGFKANPVVSARVSVDESNNVIVKLLSVNDFKLEIDIPGMPGWLKSFLSGIISFLTRPIVQLIGTLILQTISSFVVYTIPEFTIDLEGKKLDILVSGIDISTITDSGNKKLLTVTGDVEVKKE
ncbi:hypothetical protein ACFLQP_00130 [Acidobacteriota bacterium]